MAWLQLGSRRLEWSSPAVCVGLWPLAIRLDFSVVGSLVYLAGVLEVKWVWVGLAEHLVHVPTSHPPIVPFSPRQNEDEPSPLPSFTSIPYRGEKNVLLMNKPRGSASLASANRTKSFVHSLCDDQDGRQQHPNSE